jgi:hypothetical protein
MIPKKAKTFIPKVSEELNLDQELVENIFNFYWDDVSKILRNIEHTRVYIEQLGEFRIKHWLLTKKILEYTDIVEKNKAQTFSQKMKKEDDKSLLNKMITLQEVFAEEYSNKLIKKQQRNEYTGSKKNMEQ